ncbi:glycosyltransferase family 2 protein [Spirosoma sp. KNUC1025]|uniref:glycosyltransferase family 2 protein n=1 Tax=Spirosoma sp. KNUC1025 TaxID=2894082 RepID=UPI00386C3B1B|nr:glycosyltransferase family 2 protein [Spirosoma sp. KNUC1025]
MKPITCSVLVATYNRPVALERCLISLFQQSLLPLEIIICDDGSAEPTRQLIERMEPLSPVPMLHIWQPDDGFQLARIRNMGMAAAKGDYIIQIDGDVILHHHFVRDHMHHARPGFFFSGTQYHLTPAITQRLIDERTLSLKDAMREASQHQSPPTSFKEALQQSRWNWGRTRILPLQKLVARFYHWETHYQYVSGCSMAFWRNDLIRVNGYDEQFTGWGWEDTDIALRLMNLGLKLRFIRFGAIQYHLYHPQASRGLEHTNQARAMQTIQQKLTACAYGMQQHFQLQTPTD